MQRNPLPAAIVVTALLASSFAPAAGAATVAEPTSVVAEPGASGSGGAVQTHASGPAGGAGAGATAMDSPAGAVAAIMCGLFVKVTLMSGPNMGLIVASVSVCTFMVFDALSD